MSSWCFGRDDRAILVVVDHAMFHHSRETRRFIEQQEDQMMSLEAENES